MKVIASIVLGICTALGLLSITPSASAAVPASTAAGLASISGQNLSARTTGNCSGGVRCWVNLNRTETRALGWGPIPVPPAVVSRTPVLTRRTTPWRTATSTSHAVGTTAACAFSSSSPPSRGKEEG